MSESCSMCENVGVVRGECDTFALLTSALECFWEKTGLTWTTCWEISDKRIKFPLQVGSDKCFQ